MVLHAQVASAVAPLKIAMSDDLVPYSFIDSQGEPQGFLVDYWKLWAEKTDTNIEFIGSSFAQTLQAVKEKQVDIHIGLHRVTSRMSYMEFLPQIYPTKGYLYARRDLVSDLDQDFTKQIQSLSVGVIAGSYYEDYFYTHYPNIIIKRYIKHSQLIAAITNNEIDSFAIESAIARFGLIRSLKYSEFIKIDASAVNNSFDAAIVPDNLALRQLVHSGMEKISAQEMAVIEKKWLAPMELRQLGAKNSGENTQNVSLTDNEKRWLQSHPKMKIGVVKDWPPFNFSDSSGKDIGYNTDFINQINDNLHINIGLKYYPRWIDAFNAMNSGGVDGVLSLSWSDERARSIDYSPVYLYSPHYIIVRQDNQNIANLADLAGKKISLFKHQILSKILLEQFDDVNPVYITSSLEAVQVVRDGLAEVSLAAYPDYARLEEMGLKVVGEVYSKASEFSIGTSVHNPIFGGIIKKGVHSITLQQRKTLEGKWFHPKRQRSIFTTQEQIYIKENPQVLVGTGDWRPIIYSEDGTSIDGVIGDILTEVEKISGLTMKRVQGSWSQALDLFKQKKIDLLPATYRDAEREKYGLFSDSYFSLGLSLSVRETDNNIRSFDDLAGRSVAIEKGDAHVAIVKRRYPGIKIVEFDTIEQGISMLLRGEVDAIFEMELIVEQALRDGLILGVKTIWQNEIKPSSLHFFSHQDKPLLQSILNKSLREMGKAKRNEIVETWLGKSKTSSVIKVAFGMGRAPYILDKRDIKGIEYDLIKRIFDMSDVVISGVKNFSMTELNTVLDVAPEFDVVVTVKKKKDDYFYSQDFISIKNVIISHASANIDINRVSDLQDKSLIAFENAHLFLGAEYSRLFTPKLGSEGYREYNLQQRQFDEFIAGNVDVLIMGEDIFKWLARNSGYRSLARFDINDRIFKAHGMQVAFKDRKLRDLFDRNLAVIKSNGQYQEVINDYINGMIVEKMEVASLVANLLSRFIFNGNSLEISAISAQLVTLSHIAKIEVFDIKGELLHTTSTIALPYFKRFDSYNLVSGISEKIGHVNVFFNDEQLSEKIESGQLIPQVHDFKSYAKYRYIRDVYARLGYLNKKLEFTSAERRYLESHPVVTFSEINWRPLSIVEGGEFSGFIADYLDIIAQKSGVEFSYKPYSSWTQVVEAFGRGDIDLMPSVGIIPVEHRRALVSHDYARFNFSIVMGENASFLNNINALQGKRIALPYGFSSLLYISEHFPDARIIQVATVKEALNLVANGKADAFVGHLAVAVSQLENEFKGLKIVGLLDYYYDHRMLLQENNYLLQSIINKSIDSITPQQHQEIKNRWLGRSVKTAVDYSIIYRIIAIFSVVILAVLFFLRKLNSAKKQLERSIVELQQTQQHLVQSEKMAGLGGLVAGIAHEINTPVGIGLTAITHFIETTKELGEKYHAQQISKQYFDMYLKSSSDCANIINRNLERTAELVNSFKLISVDQSSDERRTFNVSDYIDEILVSVSHITKRSQAQVCVICDESIEIASYPGAFAQIISNLLINSTIHAYPNNEQGTIVIAIIHQANNLELVYQDDGIGISSENLQKIFEPFFTTNREHGGSGLGLNIIYNIVTNQLKGSISCESEVNNGTKFTIKFSVGNTL